VIGTIAGTIANNTNSAIEDMLSIVKSAGDALAMNERGLELLRTGIESAGRQAIAKAENDIDRLVDQARHNSHSQIQAADHVLARTLSEIQHLSLRWIVQADQKLDGEITAVGHFAKLRLTDAEHSLDGLAREVLGLGPQATLQRGFALVRDRHGVAICSVTAAETAGAVDIEFRDGRVRAQVKKFQTED
jgi:exodeoxyribonuclease VII large subunit